MSDAMPLPAKIALRERRAMHTSDDYYASSASDDESDARYERDTR